VILQGTLINTLAVLAGASLGALLGNRLPARISKTLFVAIGLFTLYMGMQLSLDMRDPIIGLLSLISGGLIGSALRLDERLRNLIQRFHPTSGKNETTGSTETAEMERNATKHAGPGALQDKAEKESQAISEEGSNQLSRSIQGILNAFLLFCVGSMTVLGCLEEGMGRGPDILYAKSVLDGISSVALAAALGGSILFVAVPLFLFQSVLTLAAHYISPYLGPWEMSHLSGVGGLLLLGLALEILELKSVKVLNLLPALIIAPFMANLSDVLLGTPF
tara:strand:- start:210301 stop:211131 length:831 start_codon:yes stop_codon:yes gene_type:complete